jgi:hypothetical protein
VARLWLVMASCDYGLRQLYRQKVYCLHHVLSTVIRCLYYVCTIPGVQSAISVTQCWDLECCHLCQTWSIVRGKCLIATVWRMVVYIPYTIIVCTTWWMQQRTHHVLASRFTHKWSRVFVQICMHVRRICSMPLHGVMLGC